MAERRPVYNHDLRDLRSLAFRERRIPDEFRKVAIERVLPELRLGGYKLPLKRETAV